MSETETGRLTPGIVAAVVCLIVFMGIVLPVTASMSSLIPTEGDSTMDNPVGSGRAVSRPRRSPPASSRSSPFSDGWRDAR